MTRWDRVPYAAICGFCRKSLGVNDVAAYTRLPNVKRERIRCVDCAGPAPPELPPAIVKHNTTSPMTPISKLAVKSHTTRIWKRA